MSTIYKEIMIAQNQNPDMEVQGKSIGKKLFKQFSESTDRESDRVTVPTSRDDTILFVDLCDVSPAEKQAMINSIDEGFTDSYKSWVSKKGDITLLEIHYINK